MPAPHGRLWLDRLLRLIASAGSPLVSAVVGVIRNKWLAIHLDVSGVGVLAQVVSAQTWLGIASGLGLGLPVAAAVGAAEGRGDEAAARRSFWTSVTLTAAAALAAAALAVLLAPLLSTALLGSDRYADLIRIAAVGVIGIALVNTLHGLFAGRSDLRGPVSYAAIGGGVGLLALFLLVPRWGLTGATAATAFLYFGGLAGALLLRGRAHRTVLVPARPGIDGAEARALVRVGMAALLLSLVDLGMMVAIRAHYLREHGPAANGLLQAALALSQQVGSVFYAYLSAYAFGKVSAASASGGIDAVRSYTRRQWKPLLILAAALVGLAMIAAAPLLHLLYSSRFDPARPLMAYALFGEFCRIGAQCWGIGALPAGGRRVWLAIGLTQPLALGGAYAVFSRAGADALSLPWAYAAAGAATLVVSVARMARTGVSPRASDLAWLLAGLVGLGALVGALTR